MVSGTMMPPMMTKCEWTWAMSSSTTPVAPEPVTILASVGKSCSRTNCRSTFMGTWMVTQTSRRSPLG